MKKFIFLSLILMVAACAPTLAVRGNILKDYQIAQVQKGVDTQSDVLKKLGSPTTKAPFDDDTWYYMGQKTEKRGILDPKIVEEKIVQVKFGSNGLVEEIRQADPKRLDIPYERDKTPTSGQEMTIIQQALGNMGRFNKAGGDEHHGSGEGTNIPGR